MELTASVWALRCCILQFFKSASACFVGWMAALHLAQVRQGAGFKCDI